MASFQKHGLPEGCGDGRDCEVASAMIWMIVNVSVAYVLPLTRCLPFVQKCAEYHVPVNAQYIRNIILAAHTTHDHIVHSDQVFRAGLGGYHFCTANEFNQSLRNAEGVSTWHRNSPTNSIKVQNKIGKIWLPAATGIFANGYWGHPADETAAGSDLIEVAHYLQALECQRDANRVVAPPGGKRLHSEPGSGWCREPDVSTGWACSASSPRHASSLY
ncbi:nickel-dependent hydrogenase large subunit [Escherichia coli]